MTISVAFRPALIGEVSDSTFKAIVGVAVLGVAVGVAVVGAAVAGVAVVGVAVVGVTVVGVAVVRADVVGLAVTAFVITAVGGIEEVMLSVQPIQTDKRRRRTVISEKTIFVCFIFPPSLTLYSLKGFSHL